MMSWHVRSCNDTDTACTSLSLSSSAGYDEDEVQKISATAEELYLLIHQRFALSRGGQNMMVGGCTSMCPCMRALSFVYARTHAHLVRALHVPPVWHVPTRPLRQPSPRPDGPQRPTRPLLHQTLLRTLPGRVRTAQQGASLARRLRIRQDRGAFDVSDVWRVARVCGKARGAETGLEWEGGRQRRGGEDVCGNGWLTHGHVSGTGVECHDDHKRTSNDNTITTSICHPPT